MIWAFILSGIFWIYLGFTAQMTIVTDALGYEFLGKMLNTQGWHAYFLTGPNREPFYPWIISMAMKVGGFLNVDYSYPQKFFQILLLLVSQFLLYRLLLVLKLDKRIIFAILIYYGFSPSIINSAFCLFSEIAVYPFVLLIIYCTYRIWIAWNARKSYLSYAWALGLGVSFVFAVFIKGIFEILFPIYILSFAIFLILHSRLNRQKMLASLAIMFLASSCFYSAVLSYKSLNMKSNGNFVLTDRGPWVIYGNIFRRMQPVNQMDVRSYLAYIPGERVCQSLYGEEKCRYWSNFQSDVYGMEEMARLVSLGLSSSQVNQTLIQSTRQLILNNPYQYFVFGLLDSLKMAFWESTAGFTVFPQPIQKLYNFTIFKNAVRLIMALMTFGAIFFVWGYLWRNIKKIIGREPLDERCFIIFWSWWFIFLFVVFYSQVSILIRYSFPIISLYLILIAFTVQHFVRKD
ncbi:MAG: hypothetical protein HQL24_05175 [Candidatus Omnitrophica bacterium]|nr:hypothetical protein [Candidatus Omnitrophota bacterium]